MSTRDSLDDLAYVATVLSDAFFVAECKRNSKNIVQADDIKKFPNTVAIY